MVEYNEKIKELEEELRKTPYNKRTQHAVGLLKAKIARLREKEEARKGGGKKGEGYSVKKTGDATAVLVGFPSTGKSTILNKITSAESSVGEYQFTTQKVVPGIMEYKHTQIQVLDIPGIITGAASGRGRGREVISCLRSSDLCIIVGDVTRTEEIDVVKKELFDAGIRINQKKPDIKITKKSNGGIKIFTTVNIDIDKNTIKDILAEFKISNADIFIREKIEIDQLIDVVEGNKKYIPAIIVFNKIDLISEKQLSEIKKRYPDAIFISAEKEDNLDILKENIYKNINLISVYLKEPGKEIDKDIPMIIFKDATIRDVCRKIHRDFENRFKYARVWGKSSKFPGQKVSMKHILSDGDTIEIHLN